MSNDRAAPCPPSPVTDAGDASGDDAFSSHAKRLRIAEKLTACLAASGISKSNTSAEKAAEAQRSSQDYGVLKCDSFYHVKKCFQGGVKRFRV